MGNAPVGNAWIFGWMNGWPYWQCRQRNSQLIGIPMWMNHKLLLFIRRMMRSHEIFLLLQVAACTSLDQPWFELVRSQHLLRCTLEMIQNCDLDAIQLAGWILDASKDFDEKLWPAPQNQRTCWNTFDFYSINRIESMIRSAYTWNTMTYPTSKLIGKLQKY